MTITHSHRRAGLAALLATGVLLLGACGGDDDAADDDSEEASDDAGTAEDTGDDAGTAEDTGDDAGTAEDTGESPSPTPSVDPDAPAVDSDFCQGALAAMTAPVNPNGDQDDAGLESAQDLDAPEEIADAWNNVLTTSQETADLDYSDPEASAQAQAAYEAIADDQAQVITYLQEDCGINLGAGPTDGSVPTPPTTGA